jgi:hypothetical protein
MTNPELENILTHPPTMTPPPMLKERLLADIPRETTFRSTSSTVPLDLPQSWLRRWLPILLPGGLSLACGVVLTMQRLEIADLKQSITTLSTASEAPQSSSPLPSAQENAGTQNQASTPANLETDLARLRESAANLRNEISSLEALATENTRLRQDLATTASPDTLTAEDRDALQRARERALAIACINNLKQIGLAVRVWSLDYSDLTPPNFLVQSNELSTPKVLVCPADTNRVTAASWNDYSDANTSYTYYPSDKKVGEEPNRVIAICPIHGHVCLEDGSVQGYVGKKSPERLLQKNGSVYLVEPPAEPSAVGSPNPPAGANQ